MYREVTRGFRVEVWPEYVPAQSEPEQGQYFFAYRVRITNESGPAAQLVSRHWIITDGRGDIREVRGEGVIGEQPVLEPEASFEYSSFCPLLTPTGNMRGSYLMRELASGETFRIGIPLFFLRDLRNAH